MEKNDRNSPVPEKLASVGRVEMTVIALEDTDR